MSDYFISYARPDRDRVALIAEALIATDATVWWDRDLLGGNDFSSIIETELRRARFVIVVWSADSIGSHWVRDEAEYARSKNKLIPISLDGVLPPLGFRQFHSLGVKGWEDDDVKALIGEIISSADSPMSNNGPPSAQEAGTPTAPKQPVMLIRPFDCQGDDNDLRHLAEGILDDILMLFSTNKHVVLIQDGKSESRDTAPRYVIEGGVRRAGEKVRVTIKLIEAHSGTHIWVKRYESTHEQFEENPDDLPEQIAGGLFAQLIWAETDRSNSLATEDLSDWELCQRVIAAITRTSRSEYLRDSLRQLQQAIAKNDTNSLAHAVFSWGTYVAVVNGLYNEDELKSMLGDAKAHASRARELAQDDLLTLLYIGAIDNYSGAQERSIQILEGVLARNPSIAEAWFIICLSYAYLGRFDEAREAIARAEKLSPEGGFSLHHSWYRGIVEYTAGNYQYATELIESHAVNAPAHGYANVLVALCAHFSGDDEKARKHMQIVQELNPGLTARKLAPSIMGQQDAEKAAREFDYISGAWPSGDG